MSKASGRLPRPISYTSRKPSVVTSKVFSPFRSSKAFVATVVPIFTQATCAGLTVSEGFKPSKCRMPATAASRYCSGFSDSSVWVIKLPSGRNVILSDTVGFISDLPTQLVEAFRATLEEVAAADLILHVRDIAHPDSAAQRADVLGVLEAMAEGEDATLDEAFPDRMLEVLNKADLLGGIDSVERRSPDAVAVSALTGEGLAALRAAIDARLSAQLVVLDVALPPEDGAAIAWLHAHGECLNARMLMMRCA